MDKAHDEPKEMPKDENSNLEEPEEIAEDSEQLDKAAGKVSEITDPTSDVAKSNNALQEEEPLKASKDSEKKELLLDEKMETEKPIDVEDSAPSTQGTSSLPELSLNKEASIETIATESHSKFEKSDEKEAFEEEEKKDI